jgi:hypothetical protein
MTTRVLTVVVLLALIVSSCAIQTTAPVDNPPGFFMGFIHGFISLFSLGGSIFWDIRIYAFPNSGYWYDFGFVLGAGIFFAGSGGGSARL